MKNRIAVIAVLGLSLFSVSALFGAAGSGGSGTAAYIEGCRAYSEGDWTTAVFMLKKAVAYPENSTADSYFMLISSEINAGQNKGALDDCDFYLENYKKSVYYPRVQFYKGKLLYSLSEYDSAIITLSDFCHQNEKNDLYPLALFYIAESLYAGYRYDEARPVYERIAEDFPDCTKRPEALFKIESIVQRQREEKLLYLLKQTGEEYLSAKEDYERQLRMYNPEVISQTRQKLSESQQQNADLQRQVRDLEGQLKMLKGSKAYSGASYNSVSHREGVDVPNAEPFNETRDQIRLLRQKAIDAQRALSEQNEQDVSGFSEYDEE
jgi:tetratricopeptide (TPR) repeat protein